jgi:hypothetical protein
LVRLADGDRRKSKERDAEERFHGGNSEDQATLESECHGETTNSQ